MLKIDLKEIIGHPYIRREMTEKQARNSNEKSSIVNPMFNEKQLQFIESELSKTLAPEKVQHAMELLRVMKEYNANTYEDFREAGVSEVRPNKAPISHLF